jgi:serine/threonine-protein kinase
MEEKHPRSGFTEPRILSTPEDDSAEHASQSGRAGEGRGADDFGWTSPFATAGSERASILATLTQTWGKLPQVVLRDTEAATEVRPDDAPGSQQMRHRWEHSGRLQLFNPIGRGGMGVVLKGHDTDIGRDLAIKVLLQDYRDHPGMVGRFVEEAQIAGQLQHPGVVPIYELGAFADGRPYFAMKLIKGRTLAEQLRNRTSPDEDQPRLLGTFEAVCQTMAYAHSRGVVHRDLKPSNIMVGRFGEVLVLDWGLAKVLTRDGEHEAAAGGVEAGTVTQTAGDWHATVIATGPYDFAGERSRPGTVLGTPAYMAPEQARGEVDALDERADVFALGSILCEILTGRPPFTGAAPDEIESRAARGDVSEAHHRLATCGADPELSGLARDCLAAAAVARPRDASVVAERVIAYRIGVQARLHAAELAKVEAQAHAADEGRRRRLTTALAASVLALVVLGGGAASWFLYERQARLEQANLDLTEVKVLRDQAAADRIGDVNKWREALRRVRDLSGRIPSQVAARRAELETQIAQGTAAALADRDLLARLDEIRARLDTDHNADQAYGQVFRAAGLDLASPDADPSVVGEHIARRPPAVAHAAAAALDAWAIIRRGLSAPDDTGARGAVQRLTTAARLADPNTWRDALRDAIDRGQLESFRRLAQDPDLERQPPVGLWLLGLALEMSGQTPTALEVLRRARRANPDDYWLNAELGTALLGVKRMGPGTTHLQVLMSSADPQSRDAEPYFMAAVALRPRFGSAHHLLGASYVKQGRRDEALVELGEASRLDPGDPTIHNSIAAALAGLGRLDEAIAACREAVRVKPTYDLGYVNLMYFLTRQGRLDEAIAAGRAAVRNLPNVAAMHVELGLALANRGMVDEAIAEDREAIRLDPKTTLAHANLGAALQAQADFDGAIVEFRRALELAPDAALRAAIQEALPRAEFAAKVASRLPAVLRGVDRPKDAAERLVFAQVCYFRRLYAAATRFYSEAMEADPALAADPRSGRRHDAACSAVLAAAGRGEDKPALEETARTALRRRALGWLESDLAAWSKFAPDGRALVQKHLNHVKTDPDLESVRAPAALANLAEAERTDWRSFWTRVDDVLRKVAIGGPAP